MLCETPTSKTVYPTVSLMLSHGFPDCGQPEHACLTEREHEQAARLRHAARRQSFVAGRLLAKQAIAHCLKYGDLSQIEILNDSPDQSTSRPIAYQNGYPLDVCVSISHVEELIAVAVTRLPDTVGIDVTPIAFPPPAFLNLWMTASSWSSISDSNDPALAASKNWAAREAAFKLAQEDTVFKPTDWSMLCDDDVYRCLYRGRLLSMTVRFLRTNENTLLAVATRGRGAAHLCLESLVPVEDISNHLISC